MFLVLLANISMHSTFEPTLLHSIRLIRCRVTVLSKISLQPRPSMRRTDAISAAQAWAQQQSANLCSRCPIIIMTYISGWYTSQSGKRFLLISTMVGTVGQTAFVLAIIDLKLDEYWSYAAALVIGLSGSESVRGTKQSRLFCVLL